ncbi:hypothetical protein BBJ28_00016085 [Nothophytophthora sp. Chile5]|nr:hypothetical protein BBJ28_00016085 [Nothophytophthora sp. Chile5]
MGIGVDYSRTAKASILGAVPISRKVVERVSLPPPSARFGRVAGLPERLTLVETMSFFANDDDNLATLDEALAFIDSCNAGDEALSLEDVTTDDSDIGAFPFDNFVQLFGAPDLVTGEATLHLPVSELQHGRKESKPQPMKKPRVRSAASSSTALQRRKKAEIVSLREQAVELEGLLSQLQHANKRGLSMEAADTQLEEETPAADSVLALTESTATPQSHKCRRTQWRELAAREYRERQQAEKTNRRLKAILANQLKTSESLRGVLHKRSLLRGMDYLMKYQAPRFRDSLSIVDNSVPLAQLQDQVKRLYLDVDSVYEPQHPPCISTSVQAKYDERRQAKTIEFVSTTPLDCSMEDAGQMIWNSQRVDHSQGTNPNILERSFVMSLQSHTGAMHFNKLHFLQKFDEADRIVIIYASLMLLPSQGLQFRSHGYIVITSSQSDPTNACVITSIQELSRGSQDSEHASASERSGSLDLALGALTKMFRTFLQSIQNRMVEEAALLSSRRR